MEFQNIHFKPAVEEDSSAEQTPCSSTDLHSLPEFKIRYVTASPVEEYQLRDGQVQPISNALASMILSKSGTATVTRKGLKIDKKELGGRRTFWHADSPICNQLTGEQSEYKVVYFFNPHNTDLVHLLDAKTGTYLESLPAKEQISPLDAEAAGKQIAKHNRQIGRAMSHLQNLQGDETRQVLEEASRNAELASKVISTLPAKKDASVAPHKPERTTADQVDAIEQLADQGRQKIKQAVTRDRALEKAVERKMNTMPAPAKRRQELIPDPLDI